MHFPEVQGCVLVILEHHSAPTIESHPWQDSVGRRTPAGAERLQHDLRKHLCDRPNKLANCPDH